MKDRTIFRRGFTSSNKDKKRKPFTKLTKDEEIKRIQENYNILLPEESGYIEPDDNESCYQITQNEIVQSVDITAAAKRFDLKLNYGPYHVKYYRNGRSMLLGGERGHIASLNWVTKKLICEFNVMESIHDISWLHMPTLFAVAQRDWVHIYDDKGTELHCLKKLYKVKLMEFLPYHFLLVTASELGILSWTDTSYGKLVSQFRPKKVRRITCMKQNPASGVILTGHSNGTVNMWTPNSQDAAVNILCHPGSLRDIDITDDGTRMVTLGVDRTFKLWDIRKFKPLQSYSLGSIGETVDISQRDLIAIGTGNIVQIFKDCWNTVTEEPYMRHRLSGFVKNVEFSNFEDILGIGHQSGFSSILVPGSGEPNFDAFESNPFMTTSQRREMEVKMLLDKIQPELISVDPEILGKVNEAKLRATIKEKKKLRFVRVPKIKFTEKKNMKSVDKFKLKKRLREDNLRKQVKSQLKQGKQKQSGNYNGKDIVESKSKHNNGKVGRKHQNKISKINQSARSVRTKGIRAVNRYFIQKGLKVLTKDTKRKNFSSVLDRFKNKIN